MRFCSEGEPKGLGLREHGGAFHGEGALGWLDFSVNLNPYGPARRVREALGTADVVRYPDSTSRRVREALAERWTQEPEEIVFGNGATELLWTFARAWVSKAHAVTVVVPAFSEFSAAVASVGARVHAFEAGPKEAFRWNWDALSEHLRKTGSDFLYLCHPSAPAGQPVDLDALVWLVQRDEGLAVLLDESFLSLSAVHGDAHLRLPRQVFRVRSLTKDHAMAGVRAGYMMAPAFVCRKMEALRPAWSVNAVAQTMALAALEEEEFLAESRRAILQERARLEAALATMGYPTVPTVAPYLLVDVGSGAALVRRLSKHRIRVREGTSFGLPAHVRIGPRPPGEGDQLLGALYQEKEP